MLLPFLDLKCNVTAVLMIPSYLSMRYLCVFVAAFLCASCGNNGSGKTSGNRMPAEALVFDESAGLTYQVGETTPLKGKI